MKFLSKNQTAAVIALILSGSSMSSVFAQAQQAIQISKQQFVDMSLNMAEKASQLQAENKQQTEATMRKEMGDEQFKKYQADTLAEERAAEEKLAKCMGISHAKLKSFEKTMGVEFQIGAIEQCKSTLPDMISMGGVIDATQNPELAPYVSCMEGLAIEKTGVPAERIKRCAAAQAE